MSPFPCPPQELLPSTFHVPGSLYLETDFLFQGIFPSFRTYSHPVGVSQGVSFPLPSARDRPFASSQNFRLPNFCSRVPPPPPRLEGGRDVLSLNRPSSLRFPSLCPSPFNFPCPGPPPPPVKVETASFSLASGNKANFCFQVGPFSGNGFPRSLAFPLLPLLVKWLTFYSSCPFRALL